MNFTIRDLTTGVPLGDIPDSGIIAGEVNGEAAILVRSGSDYFAVGTSCTHYGGLLAEGLVVGETVRCPLHHACFSLRTGEALRAPAFDAISCWRVEKVGDQVFVREKLSAPAGKTAPKITPASIVIVGGGAAGFAAAEMLRREGYSGRITMISADSDAPYDRPNLSKDYLSGGIKDEWMPLRPPDFYSANKIELLLNSRVSSIDTAQKKVQLENGSSLAFDTLLLATGADPVKLAVPGASPSQVFYLRSYQDGRSLAARAKGAKQVVLAGASFIALEAASALRSLDVAVHIVAPHDVPLARVLGPEMGRGIRNLHEKHGVQFHLGETVERFADGHFILSKGAKLAADFLIAGVGVRPNIALAEAAGLKIDRGVVVDSYLETSVPGIYAAGDIARFPDLLSGQPVRIEHWAVAEAQGQVAARNMLGRREKFAFAPFFWTHQYDVEIRYVGHAEKWDSIVVEGSLDAGDCKVSYQLAGKTLAVATIGRDLENLRAGAAMEKEMTAQV